jgi:ADP-ribosyl-[dinitrogen reductase] hydrolase
VGRLYLENHPGAAGNGSLMRAAPTGLLRHPADPRLATESAAISALTHADTRCTNACIAFNAALSVLVHDGPDVDAALDAAHRACADGDERVETLIRGVIHRAPPLHQDDPIGYVLLCLERALLSLRDAASFESGLIDVVNLGGDTDTNGAVAGALLGARFGPDGIPERWRRALRKLRPVYAAMDRLRALAARSSC